MPDANHTDTLITEAFDRTVVLLWPPDAGTWIRLAIIALFLGGAVINPLNGTDPWSTPITGPEDSFFTQDTISLILLAGGLLLAAGLGYVGISAILQFLFVDCLSTGIIRLTRTLPLRLMSGLRLAAFYLLLFVIILGTTGIIAVWMVTPVIMTGEYDQIILLMAIIQSLIIILIILIPVWIIAIITADFVVPVMIHDRTGVIRGWKIVGTLFQGRWNKAGMYLLLKMILITLSGMILGVLVFLLSIPLGIPGTITSFAVIRGAPTISGLLLPILLEAGVMILISVLLLIPVITFFRYYSLLILRDLDPEYDLLSIAGDQEKG